MSDSKKILHRLENVMNLSVIIVDKESKVEIHVQTGSAQLLFTLSPKDIDLFRYNLEQALQKELDDLLKTLKPRDTIAEKRKIIKEILYLINKRLIKPAPNIHFPKGSNVDGKIQLELFNEIVSESSTQNIENTIKIWKHQSTNTYHKQLSDFQQKLEKLLMKISHKKVHSQPGLTYENPFELGISPDDEERVKKLYYALKKQGFIKGGNVSAFVALFKGDQINRRIIFYLKFKKECHAYYFLVDMADKQCSIIFPRNKEYSTKRRYTQIPWQFLDMHFRNWEKPISSISNIN